MPKSRELLISHTPLDAPFETNSEHTFRIELVDTLGNIVGTESGIVKAPIFGILTPDLMASGINTSNPWLYMESDSKWGFYPRIPSRYRA